MSIEIYQLPAFDDNYLYVLRDTQSSETAAVDPGSAQVVLDFLQQQRWTLDKIFITHHHFDHTGGVSELKKETRAQVFAPIYDEHRISHVDYWLKDGENIQLGMHEGQVLFLPGHTLGHIAYYFESIDSLFSGDVLFAMGCGRLFEGSPTHMYSSLARIKALPGRTKIYCAHEYTLANGKFALSLDSENIDLIQRMIEVKSLRAKGKPTVPMTLDMELKTNPFLRCDSPSIRKSLNLHQGPEIPVFAEIRKRKDQF